MGVYITGDGGQVSQNLE